MNNVVNFKMILEINQLLKENNIEYSIHGVGGCTCCGLEVRQEGKSYPTDKILEVTAECLAFSIRGGASRPFRIPISQSARFTLTDLL